MSYMIERVYGAQGKILRYAICDPNTQETQLDALTFLTRETLEEAIALCSQLNGGSGIPANDFSGIVQEFASVMLLVNQTLRDIADK